MAVAAAGRVDAAVVPRRRVVVVSAGQLLKVMLISTELDQLPRHLFQPVGGRLRDGLREFGVVSGEYRLCAVRDVCLLETGQTPACS